MYSSDDFTLTLEIQGNRLRATLENRSGGTLRIWAQTNSWGWGTFILIISAHEVDEGHYRLVPKPQRWTRNVRGVIDIGPGERQFFEVSPGKPEWDNLNCIGHLKDKPFYVRAAIRIPETPDAVELDVFMGQITSPPRLSQPPHAWLFPHAAGASDPSRTAVPTEN